VAVPPAAREALSEGGGRGGMEGGFQLTCGAEGDVPEADAARPAEAALHEEAVEARGREHALPGVRTLRVQQRPAHERAGGGGHLRRGRHGGAASVLGLGLAAARGSRVSVRVRVSGSTGEPRQC
jgi:hypothetical protein